MMLDIRNLKVSIPTDRGMLNAVRGVDLQIAEGETLCLVGESGCGKSLTATSIMGLLPRYAKVTVARGSVRPRGSGRRTGHPLCRAAQANAEVQTPWFEPPLTTR